MKSTDVRGVNWEKNKEGLLHGIADELEILVSDAIDDYIDSDEFEKDACDYCRDLGWTEPA